MDKQTSRAPGSDEARWPRAYAATHGGRRGIRVDDQVKQSYGKNGSYLTTVSAFLFLDGASRPRVASAMCGSASDPGPRIDEVVAGPDLGPPSKRALGFFAGGSQRTGTHTLRHPSAEDERRCILADIAAAASEDASLPEAIRETLLCLDGWPAEVRKDLLIPMASPEGGQALREGFRSNPLGHLVAKALREEAERPRDDGRGIGPGTLPPAVTRRLAGVPSAPFLDRDVSRRLVSFGSLAAVAPVDWIPAPGDVAGLEAMFDAADGCAAAAGLGLDLATLAGSAAGRWDAFNARCLRAFRAVEGPRADTSRIDTAALADSVAWALADVAEAFAREILLPLAIRAGTEPAPDDLDERFLPQAMDLIYGGKSLPGCLEASAHWHAHLARMRASMPSDHDHRSWPALHPTVSDGPYEIVALTSALDLMQEGSAHPDVNGVPGMDHCIGGVGYRSAGAQRRSHFVSVRTAGRDGHPYARVATAELSFSFEGLVIDQVQGFGNGAVPDDVKLALDRFVALPVKPVAPVPQEVHPDAMRQTVGYDFTDDAAMSRAFAAWKPYLTRDVRDLDPDAYAERIGISVAPGSPAP